MCMADTIHLMYSLTTYRGVYPYPAVVCSVLHGVSPEHWREGAPLDPPCVQLWGGDAKEPTNAVRPVTKTNICAFQGKVHLKV